MYCSCPYAEDGSHCKHMAAVLYEIEEQDESGLLSEDACLEQQEKELEELIEKLPERELRAFVKKLRQDSGIRSMLLTRYVVEIDEKQMNRLKQGVDRLVWEYSDGN